MQPPV